MNFLLCASGYTYTLIYSDFIHTHINELEHFEFPWVSGIMWGWMEKSLSWMLITSLRNGSLFTYKKIMWNPFFSHKSKCRRFASMHKSLFKIKVILWKLKAKSFKSLCGFWCLQKFIYENHIVVLFFYCKGF